MKPLANLMTHGRCATCDGPRPVFRIPTSWHEFLWGGWTCPRCRERVDRKGAPRPRTERRLPRTHATAARLPRDAESLE